MADRIDAKLSPDVQMQLMRPRQLEAALRAFPAVYVPFGLIEWHGRHLPLGNDALKAHAIAVKAAEMHGGVVYPPVYFHAGFDQSHLVGVLSELFERLRRTGFRVILGITGHNVEAQVDMIDSALRPVLTGEVIDVGDSCLADRAPDGGVAGAGIMEISTTLDDPDSDTDHAAKWETSNMMFLYGDRVDMSELGDEQMVLDMSAPWGIGGQDPRVHASVEVGETNVRVCADGIGRKARQLLESLPAEKRAFDWAIVPPKWWSI